ncbi:MAG TPA: hypothetical protein VNZ52_15905, partial [Candidatus Thermoplasmatota archaeon]|nr:hypothetical protein [Candidatus Thermoplasmatota archaeon]
MIRSLALVGLLVALTPSAAALAVLEDRLPLAWEGPPGAAPEVTLVVRVSPGIDALEAAGPPGARLQVVQADGSWTPPVTLEAAPSRVPLPQGVCWHGWCDAYLLRFTFAPLAPGEARAAEVGLVEPGAGAAAGVALPARLRATAAPVSGAVGSQTVEEGPVPVAAHETPAVPFLLG